MAVWDSADLLSRCKAHYNRPDSDAALTDAQWYVFLGEAQMHWMAIIATHVPELNYSAPELMTSADSGYTYTVASYPLGLMEIRASRSGPVLIPGTDWSENADYTPEGQTIRMPNGRRRTFAAGPYARYVKMPTALDGSTAPTMNPAFARILLVHNACGRAAIRLREDPNPFAAAEAEAWDMVLNAIKKQVYGGGMTAVERGGGAWWRGIHGGY